MSAALELPRPTTRTRLEESVEVVRKNARGFAKLRLRERIELARSMRNGYHAVAERSVLAACAAKGITPGSPQEAEEWLGGPWTTLRGLRLVIEAMEQIEQQGTTRIGPVGRTVDGRVKAQAYPLGLLDKAMFPGVSAEVHFQEGWDAAKVERERARFHKRPDHEGKVSLVLGAGNVNSIPPLDVVTKLFNEGKVCILKMNPVNSYVGPFLEEAFARVIERGFLQIVYGGAEEGSFLCYHPDVDEVHITGSDKTHDAIVWGPPGPEREARLARDEPLLKKEISSELGTITPVLIVPGPYTHEELESLADNVAGAVANNASFNCNACKMLVTPKGWAQRDEFLSLVQGFLEQAAPRKAYYPGAFDRYRALTAGKKLRAAKAGEGEVPFTLIEGLDPTAKGDPAFTLEPFCGVLQEVALGGDDVGSFLEAALPWVNGTLWGTLSAMIVVHPKVSKDPVLGELVERAIVKLRYGAVAVNIWPGAAYGLMSSPWGAHPSATMKDIQGGLGWVHNTLMFEGIEKVVVRAPLVPSAKLPYFVSHRTALKLCRRLTEFEADPNPMRLVGISLAALGG